MKNIHVLPTDKPSRLIINWEKDLCYKSKPYLMEGTQNIYITSDEEIKEGDYGLIGKEVGKIILTQDGYEFLIGKGVSYEYGDYHYLQKVCKKIILTTDVDLIADNVQAIDDDFLQWFVKNPSYEKVKIDKSNLLNTSRTYLGVDKYKIIIPKEEPKQERERGIIITHVNKQETLEESFDRIYNSVDFTEFDFASFKLGAKWQTERSYSQEEAELECLKKLISIVKSNEK